MKGNMQSIDHVYSNMDHKFKIASVKRQILNHNVVYCTFQSNVMPINDRNINRYHCGYKKVRKNLNGNLCLSNMTGNRNNDTEQLVSFISTAIYPSAKNN